MIKTVVLDIDGVLTDGKKYYDSKGNVVLKTFCDKDWTAIKRFRALGVIVIFITGDQFNEAIIRNRNLPIIVCRWNGVHHDKSKYLAAICHDHECTAEEVCFVGDDLFDIKFMQLVGYPYCTQDAPEIVRLHAETLSCRGGENVVMELFDELNGRELIPQLEFDDLMEKIYALDIAEKF